MELTLRAECWKNFVRSWQKRYASVGITICFIPFLWIGTIFDSFHSLGNSSLFQIEMISLWIAQ